MLQSPCFCQECPVCGRPLRVRVAYLGRRVTCQHCRGRFLASDPATCRGPAAERGNRLAERVERLLRVPIGRPAGLQTAVMAGEAAF